jgi:hypothetical protein
MIKTLIKLKMLKFALVSGALAAYGIKKYCDQKNKIKRKDKKPLLLTR